MRTVIKGTQVLGNVLNNFPAQRFLESNTKMSLFSLESTLSLDSTEHILQIKKIREFIPRLQAGLHKGQCGRIGVIGGCFEYTGAPYFAGISALKLGADLVHVFCCRDAGPAIKSYSPELMVHPILDSSDVVDQIEPWLKKLHALVIGPGLGRNAGVLNNVALIINLCKKMEKFPPLVIDADGLYLISEDTALINGCPGPVILTPNKVEYTRLRDKMSQSDSLIPDSFPKVVVLLQKGPSDIITEGLNFGNPPSGDLNLKCDIPGSYRRCGGQGDILSGCIGTFVAWLSIYLNSSEKSKQDSELTKVACLRNVVMMYGVAVYGACTVTRTASKLAYETLGRGMTASDMISQLGQAFRYHFGQ